MRITQGTFSYLPNFSSEEIKAELRYCLNNGWAISIEHTDDPHPRNVYWEMWGLPMFEMKDLDEAMLHIKECSEGFPNHYVKVNGFDRTRGRQTTMLSFIVHRPKEETSFVLERTEGPDRRMTYTIHSHVKADEHARLPRSSLA